MEKFTNSISRWIVRPYKKGRNSEIVIRRSKKYYSEAKRGNIWIK